jgi:7,8-dihydropterin-6-yl-methyl-4-(beta-D-ribofuranosyl)aminobenzene 5'-phosphate synthase
MTSLTAVDRVEVHVLVDNVTDSLSTDPGFVENEWSYLWRNGMKRLSGRCICCAAHGLSCLITAYRGESRHTILFDTGPEEEVFARNVSRLEVDLGTVEGIVLSHGHWDHAGGMLLALDLIRERNGRREVPFYGHPGMYATRAVKYPDGSMRLIEDIPSVEALTAHGAKVINTTEPQNLLDNMFYISGEIPRVTAFEHGLPTQHRQTSDGSWEPDPLVMDERWVAAHVKDKGLIVFTACSHAGVVNVLTHAQDCFPGVPLHAVMGGFHLSGGNEKVIPETIEGMKAFGLKTIAAAHCTGWRAVLALTQAFGEPVVAPSAVGKRYMFS